MIVPVPSQFLTEPACSHFLLNCFSRFRLHMIKAVVAIIVADQLFRFYTVLHPPPAFDTQSIFAHGS